MRREDIEKERHWKGKKLINWEGTTLKGVEIEKRGHWKEKILREKVIKRGRYWMGRKLRGEDIERGRHWEEKILRSEASEKGIYCEGKILRGEEIERKGHWEMLLYRMSAQFYCIPYGHFRIVVMISVLEYVLSSLMQLLLHCYYPVHCRKEVANGIGRFQRQKNFERTLNPQCPRVFLTLEEDDNSRHTYSRTAYRVEASFKIMKPWTFPYFRHGCTTNMEDNKPFGLAFKLCQGYLCTMPIKYYGREV